MANENPKITRVGCFMDATDDIVFIDIDNPAEHPAIQELIDHLPQSYTEYSWSGTSENGKRHILVRGLIPANIKTPGVEVYTRDRFMGVTGKRVDGTPQEITCQQELLDHLWNTFGKTSEVCDVNIDPQHLNLTDGEKEKYSDSLLAHALWNGDTADPRHRHPQGYIYNGHDKFGCYTNEAEASLVQAMLLKADGDPQLALKFVLASPMIQEMADYPWHNRKKILQRLLNNTIPTGVPKAQAILDADRKDAEEGAAIAAYILATDIAKKEARAKEEAELAEQARKDHEVGGCPEHLLYPGGLLGQMMEVVEVNTKYSHRFYSLASALTFLSVVCLMNVCTDEGVHPNLYTIIVGRSGIGKDSSLKKLAKLFRMAPMENVTSLPNMVGANSVASGPGVLGHMENHPKFILTLDEIGEFIKEAKNPGSPRGSFISLLLELFSMPGEPFKRIYKDNAKNGINIPWQAFSLLGAATPSSLWGALDKEDGAKGLLSRFVFFDLDVPKQKSNKKIHAEFFVPEGLLDELVQISELGRPLPQSINGHPLDITFLEPKIIANSHEASQLWDALETKYIDLENDTNDDVIRSIYARVPLLVSKLALLHAVSTHGSKIHSHSMGIGADSMQWAIDLAEYLTAATVQRLKESLHQGTYDKLMKTVLAAIDRMGRKEGRKGVLLSKVFNNVARNTPPHLRGQLEKQLVADGLVVEIPNKAKTGPRSSRYIITAEGLSLIGKA